MEIIYPRCCGLDVHKRSVAACVRRLEADGRLDQETRTFGTMTGIFWRWPTGWPQPG
jgi:transposase